MNNEFERPDLLNYSISPKQKGKYNATALPQGIVTWLRGHYSRAKSYQESRGRTVNLTFLEYQLLWKPKQLEKLIYWHKSNRIDQAMKHPDSGLVLSWRSKADKAKGVMDATTARILTREANRADDEQDEHGGKDFDPADLAQQAAAQRSAERDQQNHHRDAFDPLGYPAGDEEYQGPREPHSHAGIYTKGSPRNVSSGAAIHRFSLYLAERYVVRERMVCPPLDL